MKPHYYTDKQAWYLGAMANKTEVAFIEPDITIFGGV
jgi:hypothetical protein